MFQIILSILKIIGIVLAALLCLFLVIVLLALFVPLRYYGYTERSKEKNILYFRGSWLFHFILARLDYKENTWSIKIKILGILVYPRKKREKKRRKRKKIRKEKHTDSKLKEAPIQIEKQENDTVRKDTKENKNLQDTLEQGDKKQQDTLEQEDKKPQNTVEQEKEIKKGIFQIREKVKNFFERLKETKKKIWEFIQELVRKKGLVLEFLKKEETKLGIGLTFSHLIRILKHLGPTKIKGKIHFGTGDPCSTGQIIGIISLFYRYLGEEVKVIPNFEEKVMEGNFLIKGRIRFFTLLIIVIKLLLHKGFKGLKRSFKQLKEEL